MTLAAGYDEPVVATLLTCVAPPFIGDSFIRAEGSI